MSGFEIPPWVNINIAKHQSLGGSVHLPEFVRLPKSGTRCLISGLTRSKLNELILSHPPQVRSSVLKKRGAFRGVRLIHVDSLLAFIRSQTEPFVAASDQPSVQLKGGEHA